MVVGIINAATVSIARKPGLAKCSIRFIFVALLGVKLRVPLKKVRRSLLRFRSLRNGFCGTKLQKMTASSPAVHRRRAVHLPHDPPDRTSVLHHGYSPHSRLLQSQAWLRLFGNVAGSSGLC